MKINCRHFVLGAIIAVVILLVVFSPVLCPFLQKSFSDASIFWSMVTAIFTGGAFFAAIIAAYYAYRTWSLEKLPVVHAIGTFVISTRTETNQLRDEAVSDKDSPHTFQLINVGRGPAKKVIPSVTKDTSGKLLEEVNPHSFSLSANKGTKEYGEILRVHGQRFVTDDKYKLEFEDDHKTAYFYVYFENHSDNPMMTKVTVRKVEGLDGKWNKLVNTPGIEVWKVMDNSPENINLTHRN